MTHGEFTLKFSQMLTEYEEKIRLDERAKTIREIEQAMYHQCFEVDNPADMQKWDGGNWFRYKLFENVIEKMKGGADGDINDALSDLNDTLREQIDKLEKYDKLMKKIYIIGSLSQANQIKKIADNIKDADVRYVQSEPAKTFSECVSACFDNIEWAGRIYVILKPNGTIGQGVTYELEYAKRLNKEIQYIKTSKMR